MIGDVDDARAYTEKLHLCVWTLAAAHVLLADHAEPRPFRPVSEQRPDRRANRYRLPRIATPLSDRSDLSDV